MKFAAIYARASTDKQGDTIEHQIDMIKEFAKRTNIDVVFDENFIYEEEGESGFKTTLLQRPAMRKLLTDIDNGLVNTVFFKGISRFARDSGETITTAKRLSNKGIRVLSLEENYDSFRDEPTMFQIYAVMAEQESRKTSIRVSLGNKQKARNGLWSGTTTPLGYTKINQMQNEELQKALLSQGKHKHSLYPDEHAHIIQKIFNLYVKEDLGRKRIVSWLNEHGYKTNRGKLFQEKHILDILTNEAYVGNIVYGKTRYNYAEDDEKKKKIQKVVHLDENDWVRTKNAHPAIIEKEIFELAQQKIANNKLSHAHPTQFNAAKHPLTGLLKCGLCGGNMICQKRSNKKKDGTKIEYRYYVCSTYHKQGRNVCPQANVNADYLEEDLLDFINKKLEKFVNLNVTDMVEENQNKRNELTVEIHQIDVLLKRKMNASKMLLETRSDYDIETFVELNTELQNDVKKLREQKQKLEEVSLSLNDNSHKLELMDLYKEFQKHKPVDIEHKRRVFHQLLDNVVFKVDRVEKIRFNNPLML